MHYNALHCIALHAIKLKGVGHRLGLQQGDQAKRTAFYEPHWWCWWWWWWCLFLPLYHLSSALVWRENWWQFWLHTFQFFFKAVIANFFWLCTNCHQHLPQAFQTSGWWWQMLLTFLRGSKTHHFGNFLLNSVSNHPKGCLVPRVSNGFAPWSFGAPRQ